MLFWQIVEVENNRVPQPRVRAPLTKFYDS
jgi:hypothetical protein